MLGQQFLKFFIGDINLLSFFNDGLKWGKQRLVEMRIVFETFEELIDLPEVKLKQLVFKQRQDAETNVENKPCSEREDVVPDPDAQAEWKAVEEACHKPLVNPHLVLQVFIFEMSPQRRDPLPE